MASATVKQVKLLLQAHLDKFKVRRQYTKFAVDLHSSEVLAADCAVERLLLGMRTLVAVQVFPPLKHGFTILAAEQRLRHYAVVPL